MEVDVGGVESAEALTPVRGKKRPASPGTLSGDGDDSSMSTPIDDDWDVSDWDSQQEEENGDDDDDDDMYDNQGTCRPFTVDEFPRLSSDFFVQTDTIYVRKDLHRRGPPPLSLFRPFKDPISIREGSHCFGKQYRLSDESEIHVNNAATFDCSDKCVCCPMELLQFIDLKIAGYHHAQPGHAKIFGFFAVRDEIEPLRNYVYKREVDDYEAVSVKPKTGLARLSLTSPARCIGIISRALFEFKICIRTQEDSLEDKPKDDILIEGCTEITNMFRSDSFVETGRLYGEKCALDVTFAVLNLAVQATVNVEIVRAPACGFDMKLHAKTSGFNDVICLFRGVAEAGRKLSSVVAVLRRSHLDLRLEGSPVDNGLCQKLSGEVWRCRFDASYHGTANKEVKLDDFATISVKVTWKALKG